MKVFQCHSIEHGWYPIDLGPDSLAEIASVLSRCEQILWIGPIKFGLSDQTNGGAAKLATILEKLSKGDCEITVVGNAACEKISGASKSISAYKMTESATIVWELLKRKNLPGILSLDKILHSSKCNIYISFHSLQLPRTLGSCFNSVPKP